MMLNFLCPPARDKEQNYEDLVSRISTLNGVSQQAQCLESLACGECSLLEPEYEVVKWHEVEGLLAQSHVKQLEADPSLVDATFVGSRSNFPTAKVALATPPKRIVLHINETHEPGDVVEVRGPHCTFRTTVPEGAVPGDELAYYLGPNPEFEVTVPPFSRPGSVVSITRDDGSRLQVPVPEDAEPGSTFLVEPPVLMVKVPNKARKGDQVLFTRRFGAINEYLQATVPGSLKPGGYFAARIPPRKTKKAHRNLDSLLPVENAAIDKIIDDNFDDVMAHREI
mmetsp:Transcript_73965/g.154163  ORF Transcript_73965/g.154163 Transcript_73965/m.154163 type:complete len:282 (-) Transcript_73965:87-932(-)